MSVNIFNNKITMTRGDTLSATLEITDKDGNPYTPVTGDVIRFAMKKQYDDESVLLRKNIPLTMPLTLTLASSDTKTLPQPSTYVYDIELRKANGTVDTVIPNGILKLTEEVD